MRLDVQSEAARLAARINGRERKQREFTSQRAVFWMAGAPMALRAGTKSHDYYMRHSAHRLIGVYQIGVTADEIAEDLAEFM